MTQHEMILEALQGAPATVRAVAVEIGMPIRTARVRFTELKNSKKLIHICGYERGYVDGIYYLRPVYAVGSKPDAPSPGPLSKLDYLRRYRKRCKTVVSSVFDLGVRVNDKRSPLDMRKGLRTQPSPEKM